MRLGGLHLGWLSPRQCVAADGAHEAALCGNAGGHPCVSGRTRGRLALTLVLAALAGPAHAEDACQAWPGEMDPLPNVRSADRFASKWAALRATELEKLATALAKEQPVIASQLWRHIRCLNPEVSVSAPELMDLGPRIAYRDRPVQRPPEPPPAAPQIDFGPADRVLASAEAELSEARFKLALDATEEARALLARLPNSRARRDRMAQLEVMSGTALVALGRSDDAGDSFVRALEARPDLELNAATTPPKILRLFEQIRADQRLEVDP